MAWFVAYVYRGEEGFIQGFARETEGKNHLEKLGIAGRMIILKRIL
jgi:hypothetical protein